MDFIAVNELKRPRVVRERLAASEEMILTSNGRPMAVLMYVGDDDDPEDVLKAAREARSQIALRRVVAQCIELHVQMLELHALQQSVEFVAHDSISS